MKTYLRNFNREYITHRELPSYEDRPYDYYSHIRCDRRGVRIMKKWQNKRARRLFKSFNDETDIGLQ